MMDICTFMAINCHCKALKSQDIFYITMFEKRKAYTPRMASGCVNHGVIFILGWTIPLSQLSFWINVRGLQTIGLTWSHFKRSWIDELFTFMVCSIVPTKVTHCHWLNFKRRYSRGLVYISLIGRVNTADPRNLCRIPGNL